MRPDEGRRLRAVSSDWNEEFTKLVRQGFAAPGVELGEETSQAGPETVETPEAVEAPAAREAGPDQVAASRRPSIAARLVQLGFIAADRAMPENPAVQVLAELLPRDAEVELCLTCHEFSCSAPCSFSRTTGVFPNPATRYMSEGEFSARPTLVKGPRRELVVCTQDAMHWTGSRAHNRGEDSVTLYSVAFSDILGATVRHRRRGVVEVYLGEGPTMSFRVERDVTGALQAYVDQAAQSE